MLVFYEIEQLTKSQRGPDLPFDCPACGGVGVTGETMEVVYRARVFWVIPILKSRETTIRCPKCRESLNVLCPLASLPGKSREELKRLVRHRAGFGGKLLTVLSLLFCWNPALGIPLGLGAKWAVRGTKGWPRSLSSLSLIVSSAVLVVLGIVLISQATGGKT